MASPRLAATGPDRPESSPPPGSLDDVDRALVALLQRDGRATYEALATALGLSRPATRDRLLRLVQGGTLRVAGVVHPSVFGLGAYAHLAVGVDGPVRPVAGTVARLADAPFVSVVSGGFGLAVELRSRDQESLAESVRGISALPGVRSVDLAIYTQIIKDAYHPARPMTSTSIDDVDRQLLGLLQADGRTSFAALGELVGLSTGAARSRVLRLLDTGVVSIGARIHPSSLGLAHFAGFGLRLGAGHTDALDALRDMDDVQYLAAAMGRHDVIGTAIGESPGRVLEVLEAIRALPGVHTLSSWTHLAFLKESYDTDAWPTLG